MIVVVSTLVVILALANMVPPSGISDPDLRIGREGSNWTVLFEVWPETMLPSTTSLRILTPQGEEILAETPWSSLSVENWIANRVVYEDNNPGIAAIASGDRILVDSQVYPTGSLLELITGGGSSVFKKPLA